MKYKTYIQGSQVKEILADLKHDSPTDDDIDNEKPFTFDLTLSEDKHIVYSINMLSEIEYINFLKNFNFIKGTFESILIKTEEEVKNLTKKTIDKIDTSDINIRDAEATAKVEEAKKEAREKIQDKAWSFLNEKKDFKDTFSELIVKYSKCLNPELLISSDLIKLLSKSFIEEITPDEYYSLFTQLQNHNHPIVKKYSVYIDEYMNEKIRHIKTRELTKKKKQIQKYYNKNKIEYGEYIKRINEIEKYYLGLYDKKDLYMIYFHKDFLKFSIEFIHKLVEDLIELESLRIISEIPIQKILPLFYKILDYNEYKVKKKFQLIQKKIMNLTDQQQRSTFTYGRSLVTAKTGESAFPELSFSEL